MLFTVRESTVPGTRRGRLHAGPRADVKSARTQSRVPGSKVAETDDVNSIEVREG